MFALAAVAMLSVSSCLNEKDLDLAPKQEQSENVGTGYIRINTTADDAVITRAAADITTFKAKVYTGGVDGTYKWGTKTSYAAITSDLGTTAMEAATYTGDVRNYDDDDDALAANSGYGAPYWTGSNTVTVVAATSTDVTVACGKPKNTKLILNAPAFGGTALSLNITAPRTLTFTWDNDGKVFDHSAAFFAPAAELSYTITYTINGNTKTTAAKELTMGAAGTAKKITVASNNNGTISLTITTEDFDEAVESTITFDAATGNEVV